MTPLLQVQEYEVSLGKRFKTHVSASDGHQFISHLREHCTQETNNSKVKWVSKEAGEED